MSISGINRSFGGYQYTDKAHETDANELSFTEQLRKARESIDASKVEAYQKYLEQRFGTVIVQNVGNDQRSVDKFGASISGYNNVVIAPNILEKMANDPEKAAYYEGRIQSALNDFPKHQAALSAMGHEIYSYAVGIDENGVVHKYVTGDLKPEVRAKMEAKVKAEQEAKRARRERYFELGQEAAEERRLEMEIAFKRLNMTEFRTDQVPKIGRITYVETLENTNSSIAAYGMNVISNLFM